MWNNGAVASLNLNVVTSLKRQCKQSGSIRKIFVCIEDLYEDAISAITVIANKDLNRLLNNH